MKPMRKTKQKLTLSFHGGPVDGQQHDVRRRDFDLWEPIELHKPSEYGGNHVYRSVAILEPRTKALKLHYMGKVNAVRP